MGYTVALKTGKFIYLERSTTSPWISLQVFAVYLAMLFFYGMYTIQRVEIGRSEVINDTLADRTPWLLTPKSKKREEEKPKKKAGVMFISVRLACPHGLSLLSITTVL